MRRLGRKGQNTLEYLLILVGLIGAIALAQGHISQHAKDALNRAGDRIAEETAEFANPSN